MNQLFANLSFLLPELLVLATMIGLLIMEATFEESDTGRGWSLLLAFVGLAIAAVSLMFSLQRGGQLVFTNAYAVDSISSFLKLVLVLSSMAIIYLGYSSREIYSYLKAEFFILVLGVLFGGMILASANDLLIMYIGVETLSILSYVLASFKKNNTRSSEAGIKYLLYGAISSGIMLYGIGHIYGSVGSIQFIDFVQKVPFLKSTQLLVLVPAILLFFVGLGYKIASFPFHMWAPDVYEGSPTPVTAFFAIVPKLAAMLGLVRFSAAFFSKDIPLQEFWIHFLSLISILTMFVGNISAIGQSSVKRMLAFSSIGHAGFMLMGIIAGSKLGMQALLFYGVAYAFMTLAGFYLTAFVTDHYGNDYFERFSGFIYRYPVMTLCMIVTMFSLAGLPPFSGFVAKFNIISAVIDKKMYFLALMAVLNSVISLYYYTKIIRFMVFKPQEGNESIIGLTFLHKAMILGLTIPVVVLGIFWNRVIVLVGSSTIFTY